MATVWKLWDLNEEVDATKQQYKGMIVA